MPGNHALIFGASGITGWTITKELIEGYPDKDSFSKVTALTNRPLSREQALWPESDKLQIVSGLDLLTDKGQEGLDEEMKSKIPDIESVSHVYFFAYIMDLDPAKEIPTNVQLLERAVTAVEHLSKNLKFVVLPTGTKAYGVHLIDKFPFKDKLPLAEDLPRIPEPHASEMFYYNQVDFLNKHSEGKDWSWCEVRPDVVIGFVPNNNVYCLPQHLCIYLSLVRQIQGEGAEVQFPGTSESWTILSNDSSQDLIARFCIYASLNADKFESGTAFNTCDNSKPSSWSKKWPIICDYFGLKGVGPPETGNGPLPPQYVQEHVQEWKELEKSAGLTTGRVGNDRSYSGFPFFIMSMFNFDRQQDLTKTHKVWGDKTEEVDTKQAWYTAFDRFRQAKIIP